ncbi:hypothetical protein [Streptomyces nitrosporeus]|uniref:hypothetical protein n=1 Tax=Streptomyces nitrosporeus TaxID=28894 RepID=UPI00142EB7F5|nr:hypothetical protein [Streptomyces nitrosporeus]
MPAPPAPRPPQLHARPRLRDAPLEEAAGLIAGRIRAVRPRIAVTHGVHGRLTGHPDHLGTHRATPSVFHAAGLEHLCPQAGARGSPTRCTPRGTRIRRRANRVCW